MLYRYHKCQQEGHQAARLICGEDGGMVPNVEAHNFGQALYRCRKPVSLDTFATCLFPRLRFTAPISVPDVSSLATHLASIEAGQAWPFDRADFVPFMNAVAACMPPHATAAYFNLRFTGGLYHPML